jgi:hypothetical protein
MKFESGDRLLYSSGGITVEGVITALYILS